jgi:hypothetical protein
MKKLRLGYFVSLAGLTLSPLLAVTAHAGTITVKSNADAGGICPGATCTLRQAIATAVSGDSIDFAAGLTTINLTSDQLFIANKNLTISGPGANLLTVQRSTAVNTPLFRIFDIVAGTVTISGLTIANGDVSGGPVHWGGAILNDGGTVSITNCTISGNSANDFSGDGVGGGIINITTNGGSRMTITNCTISGNSANGAIFSGDGNGGGLSNGSAGGDNSGSTMTIINSTISGNSAGSGGGIYNLGTVTIINSTISRNSASSAVGGGISKGSGTVNARGTIIALNTGDMAGELTSQGYNLIGNNNGALIAPTTGDQIGTPAAPIDPMLGPLQDNGGPTKTLALLSGSTAIEAGNSSGYNTDQRGFARVVDSPTIPNVGDGSDIGAYEVQADVLPGCSNINRIVNNNNDNGTDSLRGVIASVCSGSTITFAPSVRGAINLTSGELLLNKFLVINGPGANLLSVQRPAAGASNFRIFNIASNVIATISGLTIANGNAASDFGGGISNSGTLTLTNTAVYGNSAFFGGGISNGLGTLTVSGSTIAGNSATGGAGISGGTLNLVNSTISGNMASGNGGGIAVGMVTITNSTIAGNSASGFGGGLFNNAANGANLTARSTILALNTASDGPDVSGPLASQGFNLVGNSSGATISPILFTDQVGSAGSPIDPLLNFLRDDGGATITRALLPGSPALDKGDSGGLTTDQRGFPRPINLVNTPNASGGDGSDIGAFEVQATTLANISTRLRVETGDNALIAGFIVTGTDPKKVIIRAIGPSTGVADHLADPILELHDSTGATLASNDNWQDSPNKQAIIDSTIPPTDPLESAIVATLPANNSSYTAVMRGVNDGTGIGVIEAYDLDTRANSKLANISTRGLVGTGDNVLFAGTIVVGQESQKVIIRALGPSTGVSGSMADPTLELRDVQGAVLETNDDWVDSPNKQAILDSTIPPTNDKESAIVRLLPPANYTAILRGAVGTTGIAVIEVYALN